MTAIFGRAHTNGKTNGTGRDSDRLRADIDATHRRLEGLLGELDRRRREAFDLKLQMRRHPVAFAVGAALVLAAVGGGTSLALVRIQRRRRHRHSPTARLYHLWRISGRRAASANESKVSLGWLVSRVAAAAAPILLRRLALYAFGRRRAHD